MAILIAPVEIDLNDIDIYYNPEHMKESWEQTINYVIEKIISRCEEHKFPILEAIGHGVYQPIRRLSGAEIEQKKIATLDKLHNLIEIIDLMNPDYETAVMLSGLFEHVTKMIETSNNGKDKICMLSEEGVELFNQIARCENAQELRSFIEHHPIFPVGKE